MRLDDCSTNSESRVEVCVNGRWGTVQAIQPIELAETVCSNYSLALKPFSYGETSTMATLYCNQTLLQTHNLSADGQSQIINVI